MRMRDHGLDMDCVAVATAERTIEKAFQVCKIVLFVHYVIFLCLGRFFHR